MLSTNNKYIIFILILSTLYSCNQAEQNIKSEMALFLNSTLVFPDNLLPLNMGDTLTKYDLLEKNKKLIRYIDSAACLDCCVNEIRLLDDMTASSNNTDFSVFLIISSPNLSIVNNFIIANGIKLPILWDIDNEFMKCNKQVPKIDLLKTFFLRHDSVILCGSPMASKRLKESYEQLHDTP